MSTSPDNISAGIRLAEIMAMLSTATDLAMNLPYEFAVSSCLVSLRLGELLKLPDSTLRAIYYQALLRYIGCNAETAVMSSIVGDELKLRTEFVTLDTADKPAIMKLMVRSIREANADHSTFAVTREIVRGMAALPGMTKEFFASHCEVAQQLAGRLGFEQETIDGLGQLYERWDGKGLPRGLKGEAVSPAVRVVTLVQDALTFHRLSGPEAAVAIVRYRRGAAYDPEIVDIFCAHAESLLADSGEGVPSELIVRLEPGSQRALTQDEVGRACSTIGDFADIKSPFMVGHSHRVSALASSAAAVLRLPQADRTAIARAGCLHEIGRSGVTARIWSKPQPLSDREWDQVRLYPYHTQRVLSRMPAFADVATIAASQRERLDGSGYHRGVSHSALSAGCRVLAVADAYQAMIEERPYRPALTPERAAMELRAEVSAGRFDPEITEAVLSAAGRPARSDPAAVPAGLTEREVEVLRELARGKRKREIADQLSISPKTVDNHVQHIYEKIGVTTRAGAAIYAVERGLLS